MFEIDFDPVERLLHLKLIGFWDEATMARFAQVLAATVDEALRTGGFDVLSDASEFPVQAPAVAASFGAMLMRPGMTRNGRLAVVVASMLNKLQAERSLGQAGVRVFLDPAEARAWLAGE